MTNLQDCVPTSLEGLLATSQVIFVFVSATSESKGFVGN
jgi:hypothetical protein